MFLNPFRRRSSDTITNALYDQIVAAARRPAFFQAPVSVADTLEGRFEVLALHAFLVLRRLSGLPRPAPDLAQDLADRMFRGFDAAFRQMGVGDLGVPKRMKRLAEDFGGRSNAYRRALDGEEMVEAVLARNIYGSTDAARAAVLAEWLREADRSLSTATLRDFEVGLPALPEPPVGESTV